MTAAARINSDRRGGRLLHIRRGRVDLIGLGALIVAGLGLAGTIVMVQTRPAERPAAPGMAAAIPPAVPARDQWYLDASQQAPATAEPSTATSSRTSAQGDRTFARDRWYLDNAQPGTVPPLSRQPRDRWYEDGRGGSAR